MTKVTIYKNKRGSIIGYELKGHAGYAEYGKDIVCAAISVLSQTALIALNEVCGIDTNDIKYRIDEEKGHLSVIIPDNLTKEKRFKADIVFETMIVGIKGLLKEYPDYLTLEYGEV
ncbi:hypothetical protein Y919_07755 [Caloranaerobacter azorensis H53214]|uniref:Ribosomal processing cysteine protease Prp n=2 Tax=Caloranaerobacter azorensis TaxID=116090 RepID=A0A1M5TG14_9FIRM|nr:ribosomal-processing cysteine protease Prp [Caloranaerobacter azorensis]KGG80191.1 hypothetical protein Y919_07755 [Caloranaerobacter azorensis H53214]SHH49644.1 hypothetical protein SAMN02745135_00984 [Caloranaerobacter azorensis DSM 13643]